MVTPVAIQATGFLISPTAEGQAVGDITQDKEPTVQLATQPKSALVGDVIVEMNKFATTTTGHHPPTLRDDRVDASI